VSVETAPSTTGSGGGGALASGERGDVQLGHLAQIGEIHLVDRVAILDAVLGAQILVLPIVILDRDGDPDRREAEVEELGMVAAAAEAVVAPDLADVEAEAEIVGEPSSQREMLRDGRVILAAEAALAGGEILMALPARPFREDPDMGVVADSVGAAAVADDVVVEVGDDLPALRLGIIGEDLAAEQPCSSPIKRA
jgi:hypothetical protein